MRLFFVCCLYFQSNPVVIRVCPNYWFANNARLRQLVRGVTFAKSSPASRLRWNGSVPDALSAIPVIEYLRTVITYYIDQMASMMTSVKASQRRLKFENTDMKYDELPLLTSSQLSQAKALGRQLARLRMARSVRQVDAAARAGLSRSTAALIESGDPGRTVAQLLRYLGAIAPGMTLLALMQESDPALMALAHQEERKRTRLPSEKALKELDF